MPTRMLNYGKVILEKVSFDKKLFWKEFDKICVQLKQEECKQLSNWVFVKYQNSQLVRVDLAENQLEADSSPEVINKSNAVS